MSFNGSGVYSLPAGQPVVTGTTISSTTFNTLTSDLATALTNTICKDGQSTPTANIKMGGFKITNVAAGTAATDNASVTNVQNSTGQLLGTIAGTNTITAQATPTLTAYATGQTFRFAPAGANTGATTLNIDSLGAKNIFFNGSALTGSEIPASGMVMVTYDGTQFNLITSASAGSSPFSDATAIVKNAADATKLVKLSAASVTTGTTRTVTVQDKNGTMAVIADLAFMPLTASVATNALTVTLAAGTVLNFNDGTTSTIASSISVTVPSGQAMGTVNGQRSRLWAVAIKNSGTPELALMNALSGTSIASIPVGGTISTTAIAAAPSAQVWYSTTSRASQPIAVVGYVESTQATAGTWASSPTAQGYGAGIALPGTLMQAATNTTGAVATGTTQIPFDDTIPQNTEGDQYMTQAITPAASPNVLEIESVLHMENSGSSQPIVNALFQDSTANALAVGTAFMTAAECTTGTRVLYRMVAATTSSTTFKSRGGFGAAGTTTFNGFTAGRKYGGVYNSFMTVREFQA